MSRGLANSNSGGPSRNYGTVSTDPEMGFSPTELYNLSENITTNIYTINKSWRTLQGALKSIGTNKDNQGLRDSVHVTQLSANQIVTATSKDLKRLTVVVRRGDKQQKLQVEKLTDDFKDAVARYSDIQKQVASRMTANLLSLIDDSNGVEEPGADKDEYARIQAQAQMTNRKLKFDQELLIEREERIEQIENIILDVHQIMLGLGGLITEQGEAIDSIENNIENATDNVKIAVTELSKAADYRRKYRRRICFLLFIAAIVVSLLLWILISTFKS